MDFTPVQRIYPSHDDPTSATLKVMLPALLVPPAAASLAYFLCYGGFEGPIDWAMNTVTHGSRDTPRVALTFDDGPHPDHTPRLVDTLAALDARATFFLLGKQVAAHPEIAAAVARAGHEVGNHTYHHRYLPLVSSTTVREELDRCDEAIASATGVVPQIARPPYGGRSPFTVRAFADRGKRCVLWDVNSFDWKGAPAEVVAQRVLEQVRPGSIVLLHEARSGGDCTIAAVRIIVCELRRRGFELATVSQLLDG